MSLYCGPLQFLAEELVLAIDGLEIDSRDTWRITLDEDGAVDAIEHDDNGHGHVIPKSHPLWSPIAQAVEQDYAARIRQTLDEYVDDLPAQDADRRYDARVQA